MTDSSVVSADELEPEIDQEWDDTPTSLQLRAIFAVLAGTLLLWSQAHSHIDTHANWMRWIQLAVITNLVLPLGIVWLFFAQTIRHVPYLKNQALNAWNYGWNVRNWKTDLKLSTIMIVAMLPVLAFAARESSTRTFYQTQYFPSSADVSLGALLLSLVVWMFCWEWFFRGFLLFGTAQAFPDKWAPFVAIPLQAALFGLAHWGKPMPEFYASFVGGLIFGTVAWRQKSFLAPFLTHAAIHVIWAILILRV